MKKSGVLSVFCAGMFCWQACVHQKGQVLQTKADAQHHTSDLSGDWKLQFDLGPVGLPVLAHIDLQNHLQIQNASEIIPCGKVNFRGDSVFFATPVFDNEFRGVYKNKDTITGLWCNLSRGKYALPFTLSRIPSRLPQTAFTETNLKDFTWEVTFSPNTEDAYKAIGIFHPAQHSGLNSPTAWEGTFLTETGDYRFLSGVHDGNGLTLSCFDGSHAFHFTATYHAQGDSLIGVFYSGNHWSEPWVAVKNPNAKLADPETLTYLTTPDSSIQFTFPDLNQVATTFPSEKYTNKVTIIQIMGSWCPNCKDETEYLTQVYQKYHAKGLEVLSLCFERSDDLNTSIRQVSKMKENLSAPYPFLIAGTANKKSASKKLPALNHIMSFPTTLYVDKRGKVRKVYTGFYGPGTGKYYARFVEDNERFIQKLLFE